ncbi:MAG TPA: hypothetical protein VK675_00860 [Candidatus Paceibacterota bacterium]|nr:hypothetical protein [Candidatus Paceibacterota bacterium]
MRKQSSIKNLIVVPLIASAIFLSSPSFASRPLQKVTSEITERSDNEVSSNDRKVIVGTVASVSGTVIEVASEKNIHFTVEARDATIMKDRKEANANPILVPITGVEVGDAILVRGRIDETELS